jgi:hypothetical protein
MSQGGLGGRRHSLAAALTTAGVAFAVLTAAGSAWAHQGDALNLSTQAATSPNPVVAAAGDIACDPLDPDFNFGFGNSDCRQRAVSDLMVNAGLSAVLPLGDNQYYCGGYDAFLQSYDESWGRFKSITRPVIGNHEYLTEGGSFGGTGCDLSNTGAAGHWDYYNGRGSTTGPAGERGKGYYSFDVGSWHLVALNSNCTQAGGCGSTSPQGKWLAADLAAHPNQCTLAYWHIPRFSSGGRESASTAPLWDLLYAGGAELVLSGHDHIYERFAPQTGDGTLDMERGVRSFVVGTGGANHTSVRTVATNSEIYEDHTYGVLMLTLGAASYGWSFVPEPGGTFTDSGSQSCHKSGAAPDTNAPSAPHSLSATAVSGDTINLSWSGSSDDVGVSGYTIYRDGAAIANVGPDTLSYSDAIGTTGTRYGYAVEAFDESGNRSSKSNGASASTYWATELKFTPVADTYVNAKAKKNHGTETRLETDASPVSISYLRFDLSGLGTVTSAKLRILPTASSASGFDVRPVASNQWGETTTTYENRPTAGAVAASSGALQANAWKEVDVASLVNADGLLSVALTSSDPNAIGYASRETGAAAPQLLVGTEATIPPPQTLQFSPTADAYVDAGQPAANFGSVDKLRTNVSPEVRSYLKFDLSGLRENVTKAKLRIMPRQDSATSFDVRTVDDNQWSESTITYATRPAVGTVAASAGAVTRGAWKEVDVTSAVKQNGTLSLALTASPGSKTIDYASRERAAEAPQLIVTSQVGATDTVGPSEPTLTSATASRPTRVELAWTGSSDDVGVSGYTIYRDGAAVALVGPDVREFSDTGVAPGGTYAYEIDAFDGADNHSAKSNALAAITPDVSSLAFTAMADTYVDAGSPAATFGTLSQLRLDATPDVRAFLKFDLSGVRSNVLSAKLRVYANSSNSVGYEVRGVVDDGWSESLTYDTRPAAGAVAGTSGPTTAGSWTEVDVTSLIDGDGLLSLALTTTSPTNASYASRETGVTAPQLLIESF